MSNFKFNLVIKSVEGGVSEVSSFVKMYEMLQFISENPSETNVIQIKRLLSEVRGES